MTLNNKAFKFKGKNNVKISRLIKKKTFKITKRFEASSDNIEIFIINFL